MPRKSVCLLLNVLWGAFASPVGALELEIVSSFSTVGLTWSPASIAADLERDVLLLGGTDGSITEVSRDGSFIALIVPPGLVDGRRPAADRAIAVIPTLDLLYCAGGYPVTDLHKYTRSGDRLLTTGVYGSQSFQGLVLEPRDPVGVLHMLNHQEIVSWTLNAAADLDGTRYRYYLSLRRGEAEAISGFVLFPEHGYFLVSLQQAQLLLVPVKNLSPRHGEMITLEVTARIDLTPLGIGAVDDLAFDAVREHLYLTDSSQEGVFELAFVAPVFHRGDADGSGDASIVDALYTFNFLFLDGPVPTCLESADANNDGRIDVSDAIALLNFRFLGGPAPPAPGPPGFPCGPEPDPRDSLFGLGCEAYGRC